MTKPAYLPLDGAAIDLAVHPLRDAALDEIHARPFHRLAAPRRLLHFAFQVNREEAERDREAMRALCERHMFLPPQPGAQYHRLMRQNFNLRWEQHTEFTTQTWDFRLSNKAALKPEGHTPLPMEDFWQPGPMLVALDIVVLRLSHARGVEGAFDETSLAHSKTDDGLAEVFTDFKRDSKGFTRIVIVDHGLGDVAAGSLVQRMIEIETYRTLALLGLPEARRIGPKVREIEVTLAKLIDESRSASGIADNRRILDELTRLTADLEAISAEVTYRFAASRAYDDIVFQRLDVLDDKQIGTHTTWRDFLARRMAPARRTLNAMQDRLADLSRKLTRATQLLRTRVDVEQEQQNQELLKSMNERTRLQLRLQQTVEGLSVAAVSYYLVGLIYYALQGLAKMGIVRDAQVGAAVMVPLVVLFVWFMVRRLKKRMGEG
ncbi:MAG: DUF3422 family protein [Beijerinckiaceae bacterium]